MALNVTPAGDGTWNVVDADGTVLANGLTNGAAWNERDRLSLRRFGRVTRLGGESDLATVSRAEARKSSNGPQSIVVDRQEITAIRFALIDADKMLDTPGLSKSDLREKLQEIGSELAGLIDQAPFVTRG